MRLSIIMFFYMLITRLQCGCFRRIILASVWQVQINWYNITSPILFHITPSSLNACKWYLCVMIYYTTFLHESSLNSTLRVLLVGSCVLYNPSNQVFMDIATRLSSRLHYITVITNSRRTLITRLQFNHILIWLPLESTASSILKHNS